MPPIRFRSRHLHATLVEHLRTQLDVRGWVTPPVNFSTQPVTVLDYQPDDRGTAVSQNTVAVSLGDLDDDDDEELGASLGGLRSASYPTFIDVYMSQQALSIAICDDIRQMFTDLNLPLIDQMTGNPAPAQTIEISSIVGPERPQGASGSDVFKRYWRTMRLVATLYFNS